MALKTHKFARKPFYVDAVRVSEDNMEEVAQWCGGEVKTDEDGTKYIFAKTHRPLNDRQRHAYIGDWVLFAGTGFKVYTPKAFDKSFEKVKHLTKEQADAAGITVPHEPRPKKRTQPPAKKAAAVKDAAKNAVAKVAAAPAAVRKEKDDIDNLIEEVTGTN